MFITTVTVPYLLNSTAQISRIYEFGDTEPICETTHDNGKILTKRSWNNKASAEAFLDYAREVYGTEAIIGTIEEVNQ